MCEVFHSPAADRYLDCRDALGDGQQRCFGKMGVGADRLALPRQRSTYHSHESAPSAQYSQERLAVRRSGAVLTCAASFLTCWRSRRALLSSTAITITRATVRAGTRYVSRSQTIPR